MAARDGFSRLLSRLAAPVRALRRSGLAAGVRLGLQRWRESLRPPFDVYRPDMLDDLLRRCGAPPLAASPADAERDEAGAVRYALARLQRDPDLRARFPRALSDGPDGGYSRWLCSSGLSAAAAGHVRAAFARRPGRQVRRIFDFRRDLRAAFPLGLVPPAQRPFARWLLTHGKAAFPLRDEAILWFLFESAEDPAAAVAAAYLRNPEWQTRFPDALTADGRRPFLAWLRRRYGRVVEGITSRDRESAAGRPGLESSEAPAIPAAPDRPGVNLLGHFCHPSGIREALLDIDRALHAAGVPTSCRDVPCLLDTDLPDHDRYLGLERYDVTLMLTHEPFARVLYPDAGLAARRDVYRIAVWYWELEWVPPQWRERARDVREIWAPTRFIADAMRPVMPVPVFDMFPGVTVGDVPALSRSHFGLPDGRCLFLFVFDMCSVMERKNPSALIRAFRRAFRPDDRASLAIKVSRGAWNPAGLARLREEAAEAGAFLIDRVLPREECLALFNACDCYVSLHRSEGLGLTLAEAMLLGKPAIATGYSGNLHFMNRDNSLLVGYERTEIPEDLPPSYPKGCVWAEPSVEEAAHWMRWVYEHREEARALGARGREEAGRLLAPEAAGRRMRRRLEEIRAGR